MAFYYGWHRYCIDIVYNIKNLTVVGLEVEKTISISAMEAAALTCKLQNGLKPSISSPMAVSFLSPLHLLVTSTTLFSQRRVISCTLRTQPSPPPASTSLTKPTPTSLVLNPNSIPNSSSPDSSPPVSCALQCPHFQSYVLYSIPNLLQFQLCYISFFFFGILNCFCHVD